MSLIISKPQDPPSAQEPLSLSDHIQQISAPPHPSLLLGVYSEGRHKARPKYIRLNEARHVLIGGLPRISGKTNLMQQMIGFAARNYAQDIRFLAFNGISPEWNPLKDSPVLLEKVGCTEDDFHSQMEKVQTSIEDRREQLWKQGVPSIVDYNRLNGNSSMPYCVWLINEPLSFINQLRRDQQIEDLMPLMLNLGWIMVVNVQVFDQISQRLRRRFDCRVGMAQRYGHDLARILDISDFHDYSPSLEPGEMYVCESNKKPVRLQSYHAPIEDIQHWFPKAAKV